MSPPSRSLWLRSTACSNPTSATAPPPTSPLTRAACIRPTAPTSINAPHPVPHHRQHSAVAPIRRREQRTHHLTQPNISPPQPNRPRPRSHHPVLPPQSQSQRPRRLDRPIQPQRSQCRLPRLLHHRPGPDRPRRLEPLEHRHLVPIPHQHQRRRQPRRTTPRHSNAPLARSVPQIAHYPRPTPQNTGNPGTIPRSPARNAVCWNCAPNGTYGTSWNA